MNGAERVMPVKEVRRRADGKWGIQLAESWTWYGDRDLLLQAARRVYPGTAFRFVDETSGAALPDVPGGTPYPEGTRHRPVADRAPGEWTAEWGK